jgi:aspartate beta-hydroxylase
MNENAKLIADAEAAYHKGDLVFARTKLRRVLETEPNNLPALNGLAGIAMQQRKYEHAVQFSSKLRDLQPNNVSVRHNLAVAMVQLGQREQACHELEMALQLEPDNLSARLHLGLYLSERGDALAGCRQYVLALRLAEKYKSAGAITPQLQYLLNGASRVLSDLREKAYRDEVADLRAEHGDAALRRIDHAIEIYAGKRKAEYTHPKQRPAAIYIPDMIPRPFFEREDFPWIGELEAATDTIREELLALVRADFPGFEPYIQLPTGHPSAKAWGELNNSSNWSVLHLYRHGKLIEANANRCPRTMEILSRLPLMHVPSHAPEVVFSVLKPGAHIPLHYGSVNGRLIVHLPLIVPENCGALCAAGEARAWQEGRCLIFDDSIEHEAWNKSDQVRVVMLIDIWNPQLTPVEQAAFSGALKSVDEFNVSVMGEFAPSFD